MLYYNQREGIFPSRKYQKRKVRGMATLTQQELNKLIEKADYVELDEENSVCGSGSGIIEINGKTLDVTEVFKTCWTCVYEVVEI